MAQSTEKLKLVHPFPKPRSRTRWVEQKLGSKAMPRAQEYLHALLPGGWETYFVASHAGRFWGLRVRCPLCDEKIPDECNYGSRRWRWLAVHLSVAHKGDER
jgi:hypothetical protein